MISRSFLFPLFRLFSPFLLLILVNSSASPVDEFRDWFLNCKDSLNCDSTLSKDIPLWKYEETGNCGYNETMKVNCQGSHATIEILGAKHELLGFSMKDQILIIAEIDFSDRFCLPEKLISSSSIYAMIQVTDDCEHNQIPDNSNCSGADCTLSAVVPISQWLLKECGYDLKKVAQHIVDEFKTAQKVCGSCSVPGGVCGYDLLSNQTSCYCQSQSPSKRFEGCPSPPASGDEEEEKYMNCNSSLKCLPYPNLGYPFWGPNRPDYCGHPSFELSCGDENLEITIKSIAYQILNIDTNTQTLKVARIDYWGNICPQNLKNNTFDSNLFYYSSNTQPIELLYDCPSLPDNPLGQFSCNTNSTNLIVTQNTNSDIPNPMRCNHRIDVAISRSEMETLQTNPSGENLLKALKNGFELQWRIENSVCYRCQESGGQCGSDPNSGEFTCYCLDGAFKTTCGSTPSDKPEKPNKTTPLIIDKPKKPKKTTPLIIGVSIGGACLVATIIGCCFFFCLRRKNKRPIGTIRREGPSPLVSEHLSYKDTSPPPPLLNSLQTQCIPSYPSSKSDHLEKTGTNHDFIQIFNYAELEKATDNFNRSRELGDGGFGTVYYGKLKDGREVAVKRLYEHNCKRVEQFMNEVDILAHLQHKNLVKLYGCTSRFSQSLLLVYEYIPNGTVADHLHGSRAKFSLLSWPIRLRIAIETANALAYLHGSEIIHRDVKTNNILLDSNFTVKVADFGISRLFPTDVTHVSTAPQGTPGYVDPEYYQCYQLTTKSDVYSFGVVLIELISSLRAVDTYRKQQDINLSNMAVSKIQSHALNELIDPKLDFDKNHEVMRAITSVAALAFRCLQHERDLRPSMEAVVEGLREIENEASSLEMAKVVDIGVVGDDIESMKRMLPSFLPNSVISDNWVTCSTTTNSL